MKKNLILLTTLILGFTSLQAKKVSTKNAEAVAMQLVTNEGNLTRTTSQLTLVHTEFNNQRVGIRSSGTNTPTYYVFSKGENKGFVIVSADDVANPVLGYSDKGNYDVSNLPINFESWMEGISDEITYAIENQLEQDPETKATWDSYLNGTPNLRSAQTRAAVGPLIQTAWGQRSPYNLLAPTGTPAGCVAVVMGQIMKYHNYPASPTKTIPGYTTKTDKYVIPSISPSSYDWNNMVNDYSVTTSTEQQDAVAKLMYDCAVSVQMNYTPSASSAYSNDVYTALVQYFGYNNKLEKKYKSYYNNTQWDNLLMTEIDANRPIYYSASDPSTGHAFACDGYDNQGLFHFNWGWYGTYDGYYATTALNPREFNFIKDHMVIIGIKPSTGAELKINSSAGLTCDKSTLYTGDSFTVKATLTNLGDTDFSGLVGVAIVDADDNIIAILGEVSQQLKQNGSVSINRTNSMPKSIESGDYFIKLVSKGTNDSNWYVLSGNGTFVNKAAIKVIYDTRTHRLAIKSGNSLSTITTSIKTDQKFTITAQLKNGGTSVFNGNAGIALVDDDDQIIEIIGVYGSTISLSAGSYYMNPFSFSCTVPETVYSGDYKLRAVAKPTSETEWSVVYGETSTVVDIRSLNVISPAGPGYQLAINASGGLACNETELSSGNSFTVTGNVSNIGNIDFSGQLGVAIVDANNNILAVTAETSQQIAQNANASISISSSVPNTIKSGNYFVRLVSKSSTASNWLILAGNTGVVDKVAITVESDEPAPKPAPTHSIMIRKGSSLSTTTKSINTGQKFTVSAQIKNGGTTHFNGKMGIALVDDMDEIVEVIGIYGSNLSLSGNSYYGSPFSISCTVSTTVYAGSYKLRAVAKPTTETEWSIIYGEASTVIDILPLMVTVPIRTTSNNTIWDEQASVVYSHGGFIHASTSNGVAIKEISVYNISGILVYGANVNASTYTTSQSFQNGVYIVKVKTENGINNTKVVVK